MSLRDVERTVQVLSWFYERMDTFLSLMEASELQSRPWEADGESDSEDETIKTKVLIVISFH